MSADTQYDRTVHLFSAQLPGDDHPVRVNQTRREDGRPEDNHDSFRWVTREEYAELFRDGDISVNSHVLIAF